MSDMIEAAQISLRLPLVVIESEIFLLTDGWALVPAELQIIESQMSKYVYIIPIILRVSQALSYETT